LTSNDDVTNEIGSNLSSDYLNDNISNEEGNKINNIQNTEEVKNFGDLDQKNKNVVTKKDNIEDLSLKIKDSLKISANQLVNEIIRSNDHFLQENRDLKINKILIAGENLKNIDKYIEKNLKIPVERISINKIIYNDLLKKNNLFKEGNLDNLANNLIIPTGLALRGIK
jgi:Tfp pilus assembly PilM family ATPase